MTPSYKSHLLWMRICKKALLYRTIYYIIINSNSLNFTPEIY